jgi:thiol:disulfide interchange protein DsbC
MSNYLFAGLLFFLWSVTAASAMEGCGDGPCAKCHSLTLTEANELLREVGRVNRVEAAPVNGLWRLELEKDGRRGVVFMDFGKKNLIAGTVFPLATKAGSGKAEGAAEKSSTGAAALPLENSIVMGNPSGKKRLLVFTDPNCPVCAKLHGELKRLVAMEPDLAVYIKMFPLPSHPGAYDKARVILEENSLETLERAFSGASIARPGQAPTKQTKKLVDDCIKLGASLGLEATPTLILPDGRLVTGFHDAEALQKLLANPDHTQ